MLVPRKAILLGLLGGAILVLIQQRVHRACRPCQQRWSRIRQWLAPWRTAGVALVLGMAVIQAEPAQGAGGQIRYQNITPAQLKAMLQRKDFTLVNVHVPYEGEIRGTDLFVPYTEVDATAPRILPDKRAKIVVYCQTGRMSAIGAEALVRLGYIRVLNLTGGMVAWRRAGYPLLFRKQ